MSSVKGFEDGAGQEETSLLSPKKAFGLERGVSDDSPDSGFISPLPMSMSRSPGSASQLCSDSDSFKSIESPDGFNVDENELPSKPIADLWNKPLKSSLPQHGLASSAPGRNNTRGRLNNCVPSTKLCFDGCDASGDSDTSSLPTPTLPRKSVGVRRSINFVGQERSEKESQLPSEDHSYAKRQKLEVEIDDNADSSSHCLFATPSASTSSAPKPLSEISGNQQSFLTPQVQRICFGRSQSESSLATPNSSIMNAVERIQMNPDLIGDGSKKYILPSEQNEKQCLREISGETLAQLIDGKMQNGISSFRIIDCRYPYEYDAGHIKGAVNLFTRKQVFEEFLKQQSETPLAETSDSRNILIFHCEFSSHRGPAMCKFLRDIDRSLNDYPFLYHPETYVLAGGYKLFFEQFQSFCEPAAYLPMDHPYHTDDLKRYKSQTKLEYPIGPNGRLQKSKPKSRRWSLREQNDNKASKSLSFL